MPPLEPLRRYQVSATSYHRGRLVALRSRLLPQPRRQPRYRLPLRRAQSSYPTPKCPLPRICVGVAGSGYRPGAEFIWHRSFVLGSARGSHPVPVALLPLRDVTDIHVAGADSCGAHLLHRKRLSFDPVACRLIMSTAPAGGVGRDRAHVMAAGHVTWAGTAVAGYHAEEQNQVVSLALVPRSLLCPHVRLFIIRPLPHVTVV